MRKRTFIYQGYKFERGRGDAESSIVLALSFLGWMVTCRERKRSKVFLTTIYARIGKVAGRQKKQPNRAAKTIATEHRQVKRERRN